MKRFSSLVLFLSCLLAGSTSIIADTDSLIKGSDQPTVVVEGPKTTYTYQNCIVSTMKGEEGDQVVATLQGQEPFEFCGTDMNSYFMGMKDQVMFIKSTGGLFPTIMGFDLQAQDYAPYEQFVVPEGRVEIHGSKLIVWQVLEYASPEVKSPFQQKALTLEEQDLQVFYVQKKSYDYQTQELVEYEEYDCVGVDY